MKILHINTLDKSGGAAIAAFRLHNAMLSAGIDSKYLVLDRTINDRVDILTVGKCFRYIKKIVNMVFEKIITENMHQIRGSFSSFKYGVSISKKQEVLEADVIYLHWVNSLINFYELKKILGTGKPVFWFMHDMFAITGGCHHSFDCKKYQTQCCKCQYHKDSSFGDLSVQQYKSKKKIYKKYHNLVFVSPSKWLFDCTKKSGLTQNNRIYHIPNLIYIDIFKPLDEKVVRQLFSIDCKSKVIGFGADSVLVNPYKGWEYLRAALQILSEDESLFNMKIEVIIFGSSYSKEIVDSIPFKAHFLGHLYDEISLTAAYNCMNVFVMPSLAENFPNTILESLGCNTPVVGFNIGGIPDMVNEQVGYLAEYKNSGDLAKGISTILKNGKINIFENVKPFTSEEVLNKHRDMWDAEDIN